MAIVSTIGLETHTDRYLDRSKSGTIWGEVYFVLDGDHFFPEQGWTDLVIAFERAWIRTLLSLAEGQPSTGQVPFFGGPFFVDLTLGPVDNIDLRFSRHHEVWHSTSADIRKVLDEAVRLAHRSLAACKERGWKLGETRGQTGRKPDILEIWDALRES